jgi:hypothetical protein
MNAMSGNFLHVFINVGHVSYFRQTN